MFYIRLMLISRHFKRNNRLYYDVTLRQLCYNSFTLPINMSCFLFLEENNNNRKHTLSCLIPKVCNYPTLDQFNISLSPETLHILPNKLFRIKFVIQNHIVENKYSILTIAEAAKGCFCLFVV